MLLALALPWTIAPMSIAAIACAALTLAWCLRGPRGPWRPTPVDLPALGWLAALVLSAAFAADPAASFARLGKGLFPALVPLAAFHATRRREGGRALALLLASSALASLFGLVVFIAHGASMAARARGPVGHYMTFAGQLLLFVSLATAIALLARERRWRIGGLLASLLGAAALAGTFTRSSWLGLFAALATMLAAARPRWLPALLAAAVAVTALAPAAYRARLLSAFDPHHHDNLQRTFMWEAGARMFLDHPITGVGLQDLHPLYNRYRRPAATERAGHLHNVYVQIAATMGTVGLAAFVWLYWALLRSAARGLRPMLRARGLAAAVRLGVLAGLVGFLVAGLFEWNFGDEELLYPLYVLAGIAWAARDWGADA